MVSSPGPDQIHFDMPSPARSLIISCIENGLRKIGDTSERATIYFVESRSGITLTEFPSHPEILIKTLQDVFGTGSVFLLKAIVDELDSTTSDDGAVVAHVRTFSKAVDRGIRAIESRRM